MSWKPSKGIPTGGRKKRRARKVKLHVTRHDGTSYTQTYGVHNDAFTDMERLRDGGSVKFAFVRIS